jgi:F-type H+-transporting ATPase subunit delta
MTETKVANRYAKALLLFAKETNSTDTVLKDLEFILDSLNKSSELYLFTTNPIIRPYKKIQVFNELFKGKISEVTLTFLLFLIQKNRERVLKLLIFRYQEQYNELNNKIRADIYSAQELNENVQKQIAEKLFKSTGKIILPTFHIDTKIIGGFQVKFADYFFDSSIKKQLNNLLTEFSN